MAGEIKRPIIELLNRAVTGADGAESEVTYCGTNDLRALLQLCREQHELLVQYDNTVDCINCYPTDLEMEHEDYCPYARVMAAYKSMGGE